MVVDGQAPPPSAGSDGTLAICFYTTLTEALLFGALTGSPATGGVWSPTPDGAGPYTYTQAAITPCTIDNTATVTVTVYPIPSAPLITTTESTCQSGCTLSGGSFTVSTACELGTTLTYYSDNSGSDPTTTAPTYNQTTPMTIYYACVDDVTGCHSAIQTLTTVPGICTTPATPTVDVTAATCKAAGTATITNYDAGNTYAFTPIGPTAGAGGVISDMTAGTSYTVTADNGSCTSEASATFSIDAQLTTPATPTVDVTAATCNAAGTATITNYNAGNTYTFSPTGPSAGAGGVISDMTAGTSYTVTADNGICTSVASVTFSIDAQLTTPATPTVDVTAATCNAAGTATITNYNAGNTYTFSPTGPSAGAGGSDQRHDRRFKLYSHS
ncbi:MAG: hypothetical protein IPH57_06620 [Saprospiraceae bacterium]|nr:hypothetical protein [Saprospiraceae bacterium]